MAVCELATLAGVPCQMITKPTPAAAATESKLLRIAAYTTSYTIVSNLSTKLDQNL